MDIRATIEKVLNQKIESEFESFIGTHKYNHSDKRQTTVNGDKIYRNGYRTRKLNTTVGTITLRIPRTNKLSFMPSFIERYKRNTDELNGLIQQMYINGISTAKVDNCTKTIGVNNVSKSQVSRITNTLLKNEIEQYSTRDLSNEQHDAIYIDATFEKVKSGDCKIITVLGYNDKIISVYDAHDESYNTYTRILTDLKQRGMKNPKLIISDYASGLLKAIHEIMPDTQHQRCKVHFMRNIYEHLKNKAKRKLAPEIKKIWHTSDKQVALERADVVYNKYKNKYPEAMKCLKDGIESTLTYTGFDTKWLQHKRIETSNPIERVNCEYKRRTKQIKIFPSIESCYKLYASIAMNHSS